MSLLLTLDELQTHYLLGGTGSRSAANLPRERKRKLMDDLTEAMGNVLSAYPDLIVLGAGAEGWDHAMTKGAVAVGCPYALILPNPDYGPFYWGVRHSVTGRDRLAAWQAMFDGACYVEYVMPTPVGSNGRMGGANWDRNTRCVELANSFLVYKPYSSGTRDCVAKIKAKNIPYKEIF